MTDVSLLDDKARAISTSSSKIRAYAIAQASATQSQEVDIRALKEYCAALEARLAKLEPLKAKIADPLMPLRGAA